MLGDSEIMVRERRRGENTTRKEEKGKEEEVKVEGLEEEKGDEQEEEEEDRSGGKENGKIPSFEEVMDGKWAKRPIPQSKGTADKNESCGHKSLFASSPSRSFEPLSFAQRKKASPSHHLMLLVSDFLPSFWGIDSFSFVPFYFTHSLTYSLTC